MPTPIRGALALVRGAADRSGAQPAGRGGPGRARPGEDVELAIGRSQVRLSGYLAAQLPVPGDSQAGLAVTQLGRRPPQTPGSAAACVWFSYIGCGEAKRRAPKISDAEHVLELLRLLLTAFLAWVRPRPDLVLEHLLLRHQLAVLTRPTRTRPRARLRAWDKLLWGLARRSCAGWREHRAFVTPETVVRSIRRYRWRGPRRPSSQTWRTFLRNHAHHLWAADLFTVPTLTFRTLDGLVFIAHGRRGLVHVDVTANPTAAWVWRQVIEATPWGHTPRHLLRDRDAVYGRDFRARAERVGIDAIATPVRSPR